MKKGILIAAVVFSAVMLIMNHVSAANLKDVISERYAKEKDVCPVVKSAIQEGMKTREVVKTAIQMGQGVCYVVKCSLGAGGGLEETLLGAIEAGVTTDVCSRCAIEAGANAQDVGKILEQEGLAYSTTDSPPTPIAVGVPGGSRGGKNVSPSTFK